MASERSRQDDQLALKRHRDPSSFLERAQDFLVRAEAENVLMLGLASGEPEDALLLTVELGREVVMAALQAGWNLVLSRGPAPAVKTLVEGLIADGVALPGVTGPVEAADRFSDLWCSRTGQGSRLHMSLRVHRITEVIPPARPSGVFRQAGASDLPVLAEWGHAFTVEAGVDDPRPATEVVKGPIGEGRMYVWDDSRPVSMAAWSGPTPGGVRISGVYTPPEYRGRGYASACVADLSQMLLDQGRRFCALFTDLANPVSNRLYARLGYEPVSDFAQYSFVDQGGPTAG